MLLDTIKQDVQIARKERDVLRRDTLTLVLAKIQVAAKGSQSGAVDDYAVIKILKTALEAEEGLRANLIHLDRSTDEVSRAIEILRSYLPSELSEDQLRDEINAALGDKRGPAFIKTMIECLKGKGLAFDTALLSKLVKGD